MRPVFGGGRGVHKIYVAVKGIAKSMQIKKEKIPSKSVRNTQFSYLLVFFQDIILPSLALPGLKLSILVQFLLV